jgi:hypothetical protein
VSIGGPPLAAIVSDAVDGILIGAVLAAVGYVTKEIVASVRIWRREQSERRVLLNRLQALLAATQAAFRVQSGLRDRLAEKLTSRFASELPGEPGYERLFTHFYDQFDSDDKELHGVIRAYTEHVFHPLNAAMRAWLENDAEYRMGRGKSEDELLLSQQLNALDAHLVLWLAKYEWWIPGQPAHALVYLADEEEHGVPFPHGIERTVTRVLEQRGDLPSRDPRAATVET